MKNNDIKIGVIGCGRWGINHLKVLTQLIPKSNIFASDIDKKRLEIASNYTKKLYLNYTDMIAANPDLNAVIIATSTNTHFEIAKNVLLYGKDVFIEKPITTNLSDAKKLLKISTKNNLILFPGHIFLFKKAFQIIKKEFNPNYKNNLVVIKRINNGPLILDEGVVFDLVVHDIYLLNNLFNKRPQKIYAKSLKLGNAIVGIIIFLEFKNGLANIISSWTGLTSTREIHIFNGSKEFLWQDTEPSFLKIRISNELKECRFQNKKIKMYNAYKFEKVYNELDKNTLLEEDKKFIESIRTRRILINPKEIISTIEVLEDIMNFIR